MTEPDRPRSVLDFLTLEFRNDSTLSRVGREFVIERAWAIARFGEFVLKPGWWMLECEVGGGVEGIEVRLNSAKNPLIVVTSEGREKHVGGVRIYLQTLEAFDISLLLSPWPGRLKFERLRLRHMTIVETMRLLGNGVSRLLRAERPIDKLTHVVRQFATQRPIGMRTAPISLDAEFGVYPAVQFGDRVSAISTRFTTREGIGMLLGVEDVLHGRAVELIQREFQQSPEALVVHCDVNEGGIILPRPTWNQELARWFEIAGPPLFFRPGSTFSNPDPKHWLREALDRSCHRALARIPLPLVNRPKGYWPVLPPVPPPRLSRYPKVSAIIPTKYRMDLFEKCLDGLLHRTDYPNLEIVVVDNGATDPRFPELLKRASGSFDLVHVVDRSGFNFSRLANGGVARSTGEIVLLLNDDIEPIRAGWLHRMVESALSPEAGAVGARLLYPDKSIQHAGVAMGIGGVCGHLWKGLREQDAMRCPYVVYPGERTAVTGACLAVRREVFDQAGALDEAAFPVSLNDIDFCLRVRASGFRNIYRGDAVLIHYESQSRGPDSANASTRRRLAQETAAFLSRWRAEIENDPFGSPEFDMRTESGAVHYSALYKAA